MSSSPERPDSKPELTDFNRFFAEQAPLPFDVGIALDPFVLGNLTLPRYNSVTVIEADILQEYYQTGSYQRMRALFAQGEKDDDERRELQQLTRDFNCMFAAIVLWSRHDRRWTPLAVRQLPVPVTEAFCDFLLAENNGGAQTVAEEDTSAKKPSRSTGQGFTTKSEGRTRTKKASPPATSPTAQSA